MSLGTIQGSAQSSQALLLEDGSALLYGKRCVNGSRAGQQRLNVFLGRDYSVPPTSSEFTHSNAASPFSKKTWVVLHMLHVVSKPGHGLQRLFQLPSTCKPQRCSAPNPGWHIPLVLSAAPLFLCDNRGHQRPLLSAGFCPPELPGTCRAAPTLSD